MTGKLTGLNLSRDGREWVVTFSTSQNPSSLFDELAGKDVNIEIKKASKRRSLDANAYCWVLIHKLAEALSMDPADVYRTAIREIGGVSKIVCVTEEDADVVARCWTSRGLGWQAEKMPSKLPGCVNLMLWLGSSEYDTKQMSDLIDAIIQDCQAVGIETDTPEEIERIKSLWGTAPER